MTNKQYQEAYAEARRLSGVITMQVRRELKKVYTEASLLASAEVARIEAAGLSDLSSAAWSQINTQLEKGASIIGDAVTEYTPLSITEAYNNYLDVDMEYILDGGSPYITKTGIRNMGVGVNFNLINTQATRILQDGYTFSDRVFHVGKDYQERIKNVILVGNAQGRDTVSIAKDIQVYVAKGKDAVFKPGRYGRLIPGTAQYKARISGTVDWRALRLVRSEMNASLQQAGILEGQLNPAATEYYDWVKQTGNAIDPSGANNASGKRCIDLQNDGPYILAEVPGYQHPNCSCSTRPVLMDQITFQEDLKEWIPNSGNFPYLDEWYNSQYLPANR